jgi:hypothetical protein
MHYKKINYLWRKNICRPWQGSGLQSCQGRHSFQPDCWGSDPGRGQAYNPARVDYSWGFIQNWGIYRYIIGDSIQLGILRSKFEGRNIF